MLCLAGASGLATLIVMAKANGVGQPDWLSSLTIEQTFLLLLFAAWNLLPHAWLTKLALAQRRLARGQGTALAIGGVVFVAVDAYQLSSFLVSESSTAALVFLTLPVMLGLILAVTVLVCWFLRMPSGRPQTS
ncbi:MAG TPA: hypothetical protein VF635_07745 [Propionibacteriaceae bacterium]